MWCFGLLNKAIAEKICSVYGERLIIDRAVRNWFAKSHSGDTTLKDEPMTRRPSDLDNFLKAILGLNPCQSTRNIAESLNTSQSTVWRHLEKLGKVSKLVNRKNVILLHGNTRAHTERVTQEKILVLGWSVLPYPPYYPDLAPTDYHLICSLPNFLNGKPSILKSKSVRLSKISSNQTNHI